MAHGEPIAKPGRRCTICTHPERDIIDALILSPGLTQTSIASRFGLQVRNVSRHAATHIRPAVRAVAVQRATSAETEHAASLFDEMESLNKKALTILNDAIAAKSSSLALKAIREVREVLLAKGRVSGQVSDSMTVNIFQSATWITVQTSILTALAPFPEATAAVLAALAPPS